MAIETLKQEPNVDIGDMSDGHHTFNELYHQRAVLFATLVKVYKDCAWKSWRHSDGELPFGKENYFIVGIDTPEGSYTYHYHGEYWDMFDCKELERGRAWDGHTDKDVMRLLSLQPPTRKKGRWIYCENDTEAHCSVCGRDFDMFTKFCPFCGAKMKGEDDEVRD